jgi:hypothetical protein
MKKYRARLGAQAINGKMSVNQARARLGWAPLQIPAGRPAASVTKAARAANPVVARAAVARQVLAAAAGESRDPQVRVNAEAARKGVA